MSGGRIEVTDSELTLIESTIDDNVTGYGGGLLVDQRGVRARGAPRATSARTSSFRRRRSATATAQLELAIVVGHVGNKLREATTLPQMPLPLGAYATHQIFPQRQIFAALQKQSSPFEFKQSFWLVQAAPSFTPAAQAGLPELPAALEVGAPASPLEAPALPPSPETPALPPPPATLDGSPPGTSLEVPPLALPPCVGPAPPSTPPAAPGTPAVEGAVVALSLSHDARALEIASSMTE